MKRFCPIIFLIVAFFSNTASAVPVHIVPEPVSMTQDQGFFRLTPAVRIYAAGEQAGLLKLFFESGMVVGDSSRCAIVVRLAAVEGMAGREGYALAIGKKKIYITAPSAAGIFYGLQTLRQLMPPGAGLSGRLRIPAAGWDLPCVRILDYPRYGWRGMHLDVSRHFFDVSFIKRYLDILAAYKINTFHWHLTDSHGWRLEIKKYPRLTSVGGWRAGREGIPMTIAAPTAPGEKASYGGYYTQEEVRSILAYAAARFITVIPEIEMPGHCTAALTAYPQYADLDNPTPLLMPCGYAGDLMHNFCAGYDSTFLFLQDILRETMELFPSTWIHIGGDEVRDGPWLGCSRCRRRMQEKGFTTARQLQAWFTERIDSFVTASGRRMIGWDEVRNASMASSSAVMSWHGDPRGRDSAGRDHDVVMAPYRYTYFDFYQSDPRLEPDITYAPLFLDSVYAFNPGDGARTLGGEACLWTENVPTPRRVEYMLLPRMLALSEALWTPAGKKDYARFVSGVERQFKVFDAAGIEYAKSIYNPGIYPEADSLRRGINVRLSAQARTAEIRYTMDGRMPTERSALYRQPLRIGKSGILKTALFSDGVKVGKVNMDSFMIHRGTGAEIHVVPGMDAEGMTALRRLVDGIGGTIEPYDGRWVSFHDSVVSIVIDLGSAQEVRGVRLSCLEDQIGNMYQPRRIRVEYSVDGKGYWPVNIFDNVMVPQQLLRHIVTYEVKGPVQRGRYIRVILENANLWREAMKNQLFLDEIVVE